MSLSRRKSLTGSATELALVLLLFLLLAVLYNQFIPYFTTSDETSHFHFVKDLVFDDQLPVATQYGYYAAEEHQPPAYYFLAAQIGRALLATSLWHDIGKMTLVYFGARGLSVLFGLCAAAGAYLLACHFFKERRILRLGATAILAFNPSITAATAGVTNDSMAMAVGPFLLLSTVKLASASRFSLGMLIPIGILAGIASLTKENLLYMFLPLVVAVIISAARQHPPGQPAKALLALALPALAIGGWWYLRNWMLYGDPLAWSVNALLSPGNVHKEAPDLYSYFLVLSHLAQTFWASFGGTQSIRPPLQVYYAIWAACGISAFGLYKLLRTRGEITLLSGRGLGLLLIAFDILLSLLADLSYHRSFAGAGAGRYFFPVASGIAILLALGLSGVTRARKPWPLLAFTSFLIALNISLPLLLLAPYQLKLNTVQALELPSEVQPAKATFDGSMQLVGYRIDSPRVTPGDTVGISLYWNSVGDTTTHWTGYVHITDSQGAKVGQYDSLPLKGAYPTLFWRKGQIWREDYQVPVDAGASDGVYRLEVGFYSLQTREHAIVSAQGREWYGSLPLGRVRVVSPEVMAARPAHALAVDFQNKARLIGWESDKDKVTLFWQCLAPIRKDLTVFVHYLDSDSKVTAQHDGQPAKGDWPTPLWEPGEIIRDEHPVNVPVGRYALEIGLYDSSTLERVPLVDGGSSLVLAPMPAP